MSASSLSNKARLTGNSVLLRVVALQRQQHRLATTIDSRAYSVLCNSSSSSNYTTSAKYNNNSIIRSNNDVFTRRCWFSDNTSKDGTTKENSGTNTNGTSEPAEEEAIVEETTTTLDDNIGVLETQVKELKDQLLRSLAEQENTRRIAQRDVESARQFAIKSFAKSLLDTADNLERALQVVDQEKLKSSGQQSDNTDTQKLVANLYEGIQMTHQGLLKAFSSNGLAKFGQVGELFDPNQHEALFEYEDPTKTPGTVGQVVKPGFLLNKRVLRPAEVGIIKKPPA